MSYNQIYPTSQKTSYRAGEIISFQIIVPNKSLVCSGIKVSGSLVPTNIQNTYYDNTIGIHGFFNNWMTQIGSSTVENISLYPRYVKMERDATMALGDFCNNNKYISELVASTPAATNTILSSAAKISFSFEPQISLNRSVSSDGGIPLLDYSKTGAITITFRLAQVVECMYGTGNNNSYTMEDLRLDFMTVVSAKKSAPISMKILNEVKQIVSTSTSVMNVNLPAQVYSVSSSFLNVDSEYSATVNNLLCEMPEKLTQVVFQFSDSTNSAVISYPLQTQEDIIENYLDSYDTQKGKNNFTLSRVNDNTAFGVGISYADSINLGTANFTMTLYSNASSTKKYYCYMFFKSYIQL